MNKSEDDQRVDVRESECARNTTRKDQINVEWSEAMYYKNMHVYMYTDAERIQKNNVKMIKNTFADVVIEFWLRRDEWSKDGGRPKSGHTCGSVKGGRWLTDLGQVWTASDSVRPGTSGC